jgi:uncharacterized coiled-coil protein SlyX
MERDIHEDAYVSHCLSESAEVVSRIDRRIHELEIRIQEKKDAKKSLAKIVVERVSRLISGQIQSDLVILGAELYRLRKQKESLAPEINRHRNVWRSLLEIPRVSHVSFQSRNLEYTYPHVIVQTRVLFSLADNRSWRKIGRVKIYIPLGSGDPHKIRWQNIDHPVTYVTNVRTHNDDMVTIVLHAPAGVEGKDFGTVDCFGDATEPIEKAMNDGNIETLVQILVRYSECTGQCDHALYWPEIPTEQVPQWYRENIFE